MLKPQILIGVVIAVVVLAAGYVAPRFFPPPAQQADQALEQAELARRELHRYSEGYALPLLAEHTGLEGLKEADFDQLLELSQEAFDTLAQDFSQLVRQAQQGDQQAGLTPTDVQPLRPGAGNVRSAVTQFEQAFQQHEALFQRAAQHARASRQAGRNMAGPAYIVGVAELLKAARRADEAQQLRTELRLQQARMLTLAADWKLTQAEADHYAGLDVSVILKDLQADLAELTELKEQGAAQADALAQAVNQRKQELDGVRAQLGAARTALLNLEEMGFEAGNDVSFNAYRERYREIAAQLGTLEDQEQLLAQGGTRGGEWVGESVETAELQGGEVVEGLEELERRLVIAQESARRYAAAVDTLNQRIEYVRTSGQSAQGEQQRYAARLAELRPRLEEVQTGAGELAEAAAGKEDEAISAAQAAAQAFSEAGRAVDSWISEASQLQRAKDPERKNERLKMIGGDAFARRLAGSAEGAARLLLGRVHAQRVEALSAYLTALERFAEAFPGSTFDRVALETAVETAREHGIQALNESEQIYNKYVSGDGGWLAQSSLAVVYYVLAQLDSPRADEHLSLAADSIQSAVQNEDFPYLKEQVAFLEHLRARGVLEAVEVEGAEESAEEDMPEDEG